MAGPRASEPGRLVIDAAGPGTWNMAVDEVLLDWTGHSGECWWRFYRWSPATLSLGYFQEYSARRGHRPSSRCPAVRRLTGGGAILHDAELTYSLVVPRGHRLAVARDRLYEAVHSALTDALAEWSLRATLCPGGPPGAAPEPFLCFQRRARGDVVIGDVKIAGSAQRRRRGAVLQHGSLLLRRSPAAPELPGLEELSGRSIDQEQLATAWLARLVERLGVQWCRESLTEVQRRQAVALVETRYSHAAWTERRVQQAGAGRSD